MKKIILTITIIFFSLFIYQILYAREKLKVTASFYPLAHFAEQVGGDYVEVINITPAGSEPHEYEPSPRDIKKIWTSKVFICHGAGMDPWAKKINNDIKKQGIFTVRMTEHFDLLRTKEDTHHEDKYVHYQEGYDPHIWLDPLLAKKEVKIIKDGFIKADPENEDTYRKNSTAYIKKLAELHEKYKKGLESCKVRTIVVAHNAFSYLAKQYNLEIFPLAGLSPDEEPSPRRMAEAVKLARKKDIKHIFFETLVSPKTAEIIAREIGAKTLVLNPVGGLTKDEIKSGETYISIMEENLRNLRLALSCK